MGFHNFERTDDNAAAFDAADSWGGLPPGHGWGGRGLWFFGPTGVGKTHLACAVANVLLDRGIFVKFLPTVRIPRGDADELEALTDPDEVPVLILDDLGAEKLTERALECLHILIDGRLWNEAPMIVTSNYDPDAMRERLEGEGGTGYGDRLVGRLLEACDEYPVGGADRRRQ